VIIVWDASGICHASKADKLDVLGDLARAVDPAGVRNVATYAVKQELAGLGIDPLPPWIDEVVHVDDRAARRVAEREPVTVHGLLWVVCQCVRNGHIGEISASSFVDVMIDSGARYPFTRGGLVDWAKNERLLP
jgi:hypothetical protein